MVKLMMQSMVYGFPMKRGLVLELIILDYIRKSITENYTIG